MKNGLLSQIRIIESRRILPFEWESEPESARNADNGNGTLIRHPFPVVEIDKDNFLLLEDSERYRELSGAGLEHLPVQVCGRKAVRIAIQRLGLVNFGFNDLTRLSTKYADQIVIGEPGQEEPSGFIAVGFEFPYREPLPVFLRNSTRTGCPWPLEQIFRAILDIGRYVPRLDRRASGDGVFRTVTHSGTMTLPSFALEDLELAAKSDRLFPPNVIRVLADSRVFNIDFPISVLRADISIAEKELFLKDLITIREQACKTTFFEGRVYILNR